MKKWVVASEIDSDSTKEVLVKKLFELRGLTTRKAIESFIRPPDPHILTAKDVEIDESHLTTGIDRIKSAIKKNESIVVYADYDADGITAGTIMWETLHNLGANVMPYIPRRVEEGYGLSLKGIDAVKNQYNPTLIVTVDHGITAWEKVEYAKKLGIDVIITDHHMKPDRLPDCTIIHTTSLCGAGVSWFVARTLVESMETGTQKPVNFELLALASIGTIADMMPLIGVNRSIVKYGLSAINKTDRVGLLALIDEAGLTPGAIRTFDVSHVLAPRLNAMGRLVDAMDALRLLCTSKIDKATLLAQKLGSTNKERQQMTADTALHAKEFIRKKLETQNPKLLFVAHESYNQGIIGLVAGKLVEEYYRPAIVVAIIDGIAKASARSISGFNIVEAIRECSELLVDVGGHPMAAGFTVETKNLEALEEKLVSLADRALDEEKLKRILKVDAQIPFTLATEELWNTLRDFEPFGFGNPEPIFVTRSVHVGDARLVGADGKHLKLRFANAETNKLVDAIAFGFGGLYGKLKSNVPMEIAYSLDMNVWNGSRTLQLKVKDIHITAD